MLDLEHAAFELMSGLQEQSPAAAASGTLMTVALFSLMAFPAFAIAWIVLVALEWRRRKATGGAA
jgi:hypothetical protein